jgi:antitoxin CptB
MNQNRLKWACRRGMLELDLLLNDFLEHRYPTLPVSCQSAFETLLSSSDQDLINWLLKNEISEQEALCEIIMLIKQHANRDI